MKTKSLALRGARESVRNDTEGHHGDASETEEVELSCDEVLAALDQAVEFATLEKIVLNVV